MASTAFPTTTPRAPNSFLEHGSVGFALMGCDGHIVSVTRSFAELVGSHVRPLLQQSILNILTLTDRGNSRGLLAQGASVRVLTRDGRPLCWVVHRIAAGATLAGYYVGLLCDESHMEGLERQLLHSNRLAILGGLTAAMAHEIAGPLNLIANNAELLLREDDTIENTRISLTVIRDEAQRLADLLRDILYFGGDAPLRITPQDIVKLLDKSVRLINPQHAWKNISLIIDAEPNLPHVAGDGQRLQQVFFNLIKNACEASPNDSKVVIRVRLIEKRSGDEMIEVGIADQGKGFPSSESAQFFKPFVSSKPLGEGTGLGLPIASKIVAAHQGELRLIDHNGNGTQVIVLLPVFSNPAASEKGEQVVTCDGVIFDEITGLPR